ncbi:Mediator of RNA polymerase II transcription subunit 4 [Platanthera guangdongensis]|uniref:Mediator of RNA polymerase II transcription subunit 4 n=1 Tax=Platanthera guangdongensis TaxID=2320717 RepID=A0ABR2MR53_9ASPA
MRAIPGRPEPSLLQPPHMVDSPRKGSPVGAPVGGLSPPSMAGKLDQGTPGPRLLKTHLFKAVTELQEILDLQDSKVKIDHEIHNKDGTLLASLKIHDAEQVLDHLLDDYSDYEEEEKYTSID